MLVLLSLLLAAEDSNGANQGAKSAPDIHVILLVADGLEVPPTAIRKISDSALYAENFFVDEMTRWGYEPARKQIFPRDDDGRPVVRVVRGSKRPDEYKEMLPTLREVWPKAHSQYDLPRDNPIWWVWVYKGDPPIRYSDYRGSGDIARGGFTVNNFENRPISINPARPMATSDHDAFTLKGCIHELGHALGLPHLGPKESDKRGNTLMGPRTVVYQRQTHSKDAKVYLSHAAAAILSRHWVITGDASRRRVMPTVAVTGWKTSFSRTEKTITFRGQLDTDIPAHSVIVVDSVPPKQVNYLAKPYVARVSDDGSFEVTIDEPLAPIGDAQFLFCFENGVVTGDGKSHGLGGAIERHYDLTK